MRMARFFTTMVATRRTRLSLMGALLTVLLAAGCSTPGGNAPPPPPGNRWSPQRASAWYQQTGWLVGCNFIPSTAINQLEMWQAATFDTLTLNRELAWAGGLGFNSVRVFLHDLLWEEDSAAFLARTDAFLDLADGHDIGVMFVFFDGVWDPQPQLGRQRDPRPNVHNSGWVQSPGAAALADTTQYPRLRRYVQGVMRHYAHDARVQLWDMFNEPDNTNQGTYGPQELPDKETHVLRLLRAAFDWAREVDPDQPLTAAVWHRQWDDTAALHPIDAFMLDHSDVISFHSYSGPDAFAVSVETLRRYNRPLLCTEYLARSSGSTFESIVPVAQRGQVGLYNWGLVDGKTQTKFPWNSWDSTFVAEPAVWHHEIFRADGTPYDTAEVELIRRYTGGT